MDLILNYISQLPHYLMTSLIVMAGIALFAIIVGRKIERLDVKAKPSKLITAVMLAIGGFNTFVKNYVGKHWDHVVPFALTMAIYVFLSNITGVIAIDSPTQFSAITFSMSLTAFFVVQSTGLISQRWRHFLGVFQPLAPMAPLNIVSEFVPIVSMALRLFGNIASGALLLGLLYNLLGWLSIVITPAFHLVFDIGFGLIQTLVIVLLTIIFASMKVSEADFEN